MFVLWISVRTYIQRHAMSHMWRQYGTLALLTLTFSLSFILIHINSLISFLLFICDFFLLRQPHCRRLNDSVLLPPIYSLFYSSAFISVHHAVPSMPLRSTPHHYFLTVSCYLFFSSLSCPVLSCQTLSYPFLSFPILSYPILSYPILSYPILSYPILPYPTLSYPILSYPNL